MVVFKVVFRLLFLRLLMFDVDLVVVSCVVSGLFQDRGEG